MRHCINNPTTISGAHTPENGCRNLSLDKDYYNRGSTANIFFSWTGSADGFPYSRLGKPTQIPKVYFSGKITNKFGFSCAEPTKKLLGTDHNTLKNDIPVSITRNCKNPKLDVSLVDKDGNILDSRSFKFETKDNKNLLDNKFIMIISVIILLIIIFVFLIMKKKICFSNFKNKFIGPMIIFLTLFLGIAGLVFATESTEWVLAINGGGGGDGVVSTGGTGTPPAGLTANFNFDKSAYNPSSLMRIDTTIYYAACTNATRNIVVTGYVNGYSSGEKELFTKTMSGGDNFTGIAYFTSPATKGDYTFKIEVKGYHPDGYKITDAEVDKGTSYDFTNLKTDLLTYIDNYYPSWKTTVEGSISTSTSHFQINEFLKSIPALNKIIIELVPGALDFTRGYDLTFSVIEPTVQVFANEEGESTTINPNADVRVRWNSTNVTSCTCEYSDDNFVTKTICTPTLWPTFGTGVKALEYPYRNISKKTVFKVICQ